MKMLNQTNDASPSASGPPLNPTSDIQIVDKAVPASVNPHVPRKLDKNWRIIVAMLVTGVFATIYVWHWWKYRYYLDDNESKTITISGVAIKFTRKDDVPRAGMTTVLFTDMSSKAIELRVGYYMIFHNGVTEPINWLIAMKKQQGSGYFSVTKPDNDALVLSYGADSFDLRDNDERTMEIPKQPLLYIAPADEKIIPDASLVPHNATHDR